MCRYEYFLRIIIENFPINFRFWEHFREFEYMLYVEPSLLLDTHMPIL